MLLHFCTSVASGRTWAQLDHDDGGDNLDDGADGEDDGDNYGEGDDGCEVDFSSSQRRCRTTRRPR